MRSKTLSLTISRMKRKRKKILRFEPQWERKERIIKSTSYGHGAIKFNIIEHTIKRKHES